VQFLLHYWHPSYYSCSKSGDKYRITCTLKVETDIITNIAASLTWRAVMLVKMFIDPFSCSIKKKKSNSHCNEIYKYQYYLVLGYMTWLVSLMIHASFNVLKLDCYFHVTGSVDNFNDSFSGSDYSAGAIAISFYSGFWAFGGW
jgi:hypothetical protein